MNVEDVMEQAGQIFSAGYAKAALQLMTKTPTCKQDIRLYRVAAGYAYPSQDAKSAKAYLAKVPAQFQD